ncbi:hypothetical protein FRC07_011742, partial [Ceratobasidium sp. 392]
MRGNTPVTVTPGTTARQLFFLKAYGRMASLNGVALYLTMSGEWEVDWPQIDSVSVCIADLTAVRVETHERFRDGAKWIALVTSTAIYFLLEPSEATEDMWYSCVKETWMKHESSAGHDLLYRSINFKDPRPTYWHGLGSWLATLRWAESQRKEVCTSNEQRSSDKGDDELPPEERGNTLAGLRKTKALPRTRANRGKNRQIGNANIARVDGERTVRRGGERQERGVEPEPGAHRNRDMKGRKRAN